MLLVKILQVLDLLLYLFSLMEFPLIYQLRLLLSEALHHVLACVLTDERPTYDHLLWRLEARQLRNGQAL